MKDGVLGRSGSSMSGMNLGGRWAAGNLGISWVDVIQMHIVKVIDPVRGDTAGSSSSSEQSTLEVLLPPQIIMGWGLMMQLVRRPTRKGHKGARGRGTGWAAEELVEMRILGTAVRRLRGSAEVLQ